MLTLVVQEGFKEGHGTKVWAVLKETYGVVRQHPSVSYSGGLLDQIGQGEDVVSRTFRELL